jgi:signal transduction histidine kinase
VWDLRGQLAGPLALDGPLALLLAGEALISLSPGAPLSMVALALAGTLCVAWRRRAPELVLAGTSIAFIVCMASGYLMPPLPFAPVVAIYTVAVYRRPSISTRAGGAAALGVIAGSILGPNGLNDDSLFDYPLSLVAALTIGYGVRVGRARTALLERQSEQLAREQAALTQLAVEQERARIALELHDIVAHHVSVIVAQAGAAGVVFDSRPQQARQALSSIAAVGREAMAEMRRLLGVLHPHGTQIEHGPVPGLDRLPTLIAQIERAGLPVQLAVAGERRRLPAGVELSAYRIVQEALTNSLKHAGPTQAKVLLGYHDEFLELRISDTGHNGDPPQAVNGDGRTEGRGLVGMQQRAALLGGHVTAGPVPDRGFIVTAQLPVEGVAR